MHHFLYLVLNDALVCRQDGRTLFQVGITHNLVGYKADAVRHVGNERGTFHRVGLRILHQQVGLEADEVLRLRGDVVLHLRGIVLAGEAVGVVAIGQEKHAHVHPLGQQHIDTTDAGLDAGFVAIVNQSDVRCEPTQQTYLFFAERRARVGHHILQSALVHGNYIRVAFYHVHAVVLHDGALCLIESVQFAPFAEYLALGGVYVLLLHTLGTAVEHASAEAHHLTADVYPRKDYTSPKAVAQRPVVLGVAQPGLQQEVFLIATAHGFLGQRILVLGAVA